MPVTHASRESGAEKRATRRPAAEAAAEAVATRASKERVDKAREELVGVEQNA
jgi:hypothetical protein